MSIDRTLLARYLRQLREHGERELSLNEMTATEALETLRAASAGQRPTPGGGAVEPERPTAREAAAAGAGASSGGELDVLRSEALGCTKCRLHEGRQNVVFGEGDPDADVVVVGEAPGAKEDRTGRPFVGPAGKLLSLMLQSVGLPRERVFICNVLKCRPPKNRDPKPDEVACCSPYLHRQLDLIAPRVLLAVGKFAIQTLVETNKSIGRLRGEVYAYRGVPLVASYHPAYLLRSPSRVRACWDDFQLLRTVVDGRAA